jgi:hypothetical protein
VPYRTLQTALCHGNKHQQLNYYTVPPTSYSLDETSRGLWRRIVKQKFGCEFTTNISLLMNILEMPIEYKRKRCQIIGSELLESVLWISAYSLTQIFIQAQVRAATAVTLWLWQASTPTPTTSTFMSQEPMARLSYEAGTAFRHISGDHHETKIGRQPVLK